MVREYRPVSLGARTVVGMGRTEMLYVLIIEKGL